MHNKAARIRAGLAAIGLAAGLPAAPPAGSAVSYQQIRKWHSNKCLDVAGASQAIGARVQQYTCNGTVAQRWTKEPTDSGYFMLEVASSGQCLQVKGGSFADNAPVVQMPCTGDYDQQWTQVSSGAPDWPF